MPVATEPEVVEAAYTQWCNSVPVAQIAAELEVTVGAIENWRARNQWRLRRDTEDAEAATGKRRTMAHDLVGRSPLIMSSAIDLALKAESESVRAAQQRYLLGTLGFSPDTASERIKQMEAQAAKLHALSEPDVIDVDAASARINEKVQWRE